jgi:hypothetical protein
VTPTLRRVAAWLAGAWTGLIAAIGFVIAPIVFATLPRADAGRVAARLFGLDATIGVCAGALLLLFALQLARRAAEQGASRFSTDMLLVLAALFCIVAGHYAIQPMMEARLRGEAGPSFAVLHGVASAFFLVRFVAVAVLAWRLTGAPSARASDRPTTAAPTS